MWSAVCKSKGKRTCEGRSTFPHQVSGTEASEISATATVQESAEGSYQAEINSGTKETNPHFAGRVSQMSLEGKGASMQGGLSQRFGKYIGQS